MAVCVDDNRGHGRTQMLHILHAYLSIQEDECVGRISQKYTLCGIILEDRCHRMDRCLNATFMASTKLQTSSCFYDVFLQDVWNSLAKNAGQNLSNVYQRSDTRLFVDWIKATGYVCL